jgi:hypothetical protein
LDASKKQDPAIFVHKNKLQWQRNTQKESKGIESGMPRKYKSKASRNNYIHI